LDLSGIGFGVRYEFRNGLDVGSHWPEAEAPLASVDRGKSEELSSFSAPPSPHEQLDAAIAAHRGLIGAGPKSK
jgi:hypothetical protein